VVKPNYTAFAYVLAGMIFYAIAILTTFGQTLWERSILGPALGPPVMIASMSIAGLGETALGYLMIFILGGSASLSLTKFIAHHTHSKQIVEMSKTRSMSSGKSRMLYRIHWLYLPGLVFISAVGLGWDVHNIDSPSAGLVQPILRGLDIFSRPPAGVGPILYSRHLIPALMILTAIAGLIPSIVLPYFDRFKVTGINAGPFHTSLLYSVVGAFAGLGVLLTLVGLFYRSLWLNRAPLPYHFGILALLGFSLHISLGMYLGMRKAEDKIIDKIKGSQSGTLIVLA
jgi:hypothetical protein